MDVYSSIKFGLAGDDLTAFPNSCSAIAIGVDGLRVLCKCCESSEEHGRCKIMLGWTFGKITLNVKDSNSSPSTELKIRTS